MDNPEQTVAVKQALARLEVRDNAILQLGQKMLSADEGRLYPVDLLAKAALKRALSTSVGFRRLIEDWNLVAARSLLRLQIDTAARFSAVWLVDDPHEFATDVIAGERINRMKDRDGNRLTDRHLMDALGAKHEWVPRVYECTCGYVHLSEKHFFNTTISIDENTRSIEFFIGATDRHMPEFSFVEAVDCFTEATDILLDYIAGWTATKERPGLARAAREKRDQEKNPTRRST